MLIEIRKRKKESLIIIDCNNKQKGSTACSNCNGKMRAAYNSWKMEIEETGKID